MVKFYSDDLLSQPSTTSTLSPASQFPELQLGSSGLPTSPPASTSTSSIKFYSDDLTQDTPVAELPQELPPPPPEPEAGWLDRGTDLGISALKGAIAIPEAAVGLADLVSGGYAGKALEGVGFDPGRAKQILDAYYSPEQQEENRAVSEAEGFMGTLSAAVQNPSTILQKGVESFPLMLGGAGVARGLAGLGMKTLGRAAIGEGVVAAGSSAEQIRQATPEGLLSPGQAMAAGAIGVGTAALGRLGGKIADELGIADVDTMLAGAAKDPASTMGLVKRIVYGAVTEGGLEELPQSVQEQVIQNQALGRELDEGVDQAAVFGALTGAAMGGGANLVSGTLPTPPLPPAPPAAEAAPPPAPGIEQEASLVAAEPLPPTAPPEAFPEAPPLPPPAPAPPVIPEPETPPIELLPVPVAEVPVPITPPPTTAQPAPAAAMTTKPTFKEFVKASGEKWEHVGGFPAGSKYKRLKAEYDAWTPEAGAPLPAAPPVVEAPPAEPVIEPPVERRVAPAQRRTVDEMTPEELKSALLTDDLTGLGNRRAYEETPRKPVQIALDVEGLKWANDNLGHDAGDALLRAVGTAVQEAGGGHRLSGDEFVVEADTPEAAEAAVATLKARLSQATVRVTRPDGSVAEYRGPNLHHGIGGNFAEAATALNATKAAAVEAGSRAARGTRPGGMAEIPTTGEQGGGAAPATPVAAAPEPAFVEPTTTEPVPLPPAEQAEVEAAVEALKAEPLDPTSLQAKAQAAQARIVRAASPSAFGVGYFQDYAIVGADLIHRGAKTFAEFTGKLVSTFGEGIRAAARSIYDAAQRIVSGLRRGPLAAESGEPITGDTSSTAPGGSSQRPIKPIPPGAKPGEKVEAPAPLAGFNPRETGPAEVPKATSAQKEKMAEAGREEGGPEITGKPSPTKEGEPEFDINVGKSSVNPETQQFLARMVQSVPERYGKTEGGARGEKRSWDSVRAWATMHGWNEAEIKKSFTQKGGFLSDVEMERANQLREHHREKYLEHYDQYEKLKKEGRGEEAELALDKAKAEVAQIDALQYALTHSKSEAARSLAYAARLAEGLTPEERFVASKFKGFKGQDALYREMAEAARKKDYKRVNEITRKIHNPTLMEQIVEGWKLGLLFGFPTQFVNISSTGAKVLAIDTFEAAFAGVLDSVVHRKDRSRYAGEGKEMLRGAWAAKDKAWTDFKLGLESILDNSFEEKVAQAEIEGKETDYYGKFGGHKQALPGKFGRAYRSIYHFMGIADQFWRNIAGSQAVYRLAYRKGMQANLTGDALESSIMDFVNKYWKKELPDQAEIAKLVRIAELTGTFNLPLKEGKGFIPGVGRIVGQATTQYPALGFIAPFIQTPVDLAGETVARTPIGLYRGVKAALKGDMAKGEDVEMLAKGLTGASLMMLVYLLMKTGEVEVSGGGPTDPDKKQNKIDTGWQPYSVKFGKSWVSYQRFDPLSSLIGFVADWNEAEDAKTFTEGAEKAYSSIAQNLTNKTFLAGLVQFAGMLHSPGRQFKPWLKQFEGSFIPQIAGRAAAAIDPTVRISDPYKLKYGMPEPWVARLPGLSKSLEARKTPTGEERERAGGAAARFLNPFPISEEKQTPQADVQREFDRLGYTPEQPRRVRMLSGGKKIQLDDREYEILQGVYSVAAAKAARVIKSANYKRLDPDQQEKALKRVYSDAADIGRSRLYQDQKFRRRSARIQAGLDAGA